MNNADKPINAELNSPELIAQWVIDNRYPTSENEKTDDREMSIVLTESISQLLKQNNDMIELLKDINSKIIAGSKIDYSTVLHHRILGFLDESTNP